MPSGNLNHIPRHFVDRKAARHQAKYCSDIEMVFSREWAELQQPGECWICLWPFGEGTGNDDLKRSRDHIIPKSKCVGRVDYNYRLAHRCCNCRRGNDPITLDLIYECRNHIIQTRYRWLERAVGKDQLRFEVRDRRIDEFLIEFGKRYGV